MATGAFREIVEGTEEQRRTFFKMIFGPEATGYVCIAFLEHTSRKMQMLWYEYPTQLEDMLISIQDHSKRLAHFYFSTALYEAAGSREKQYAQTSTIIHCDLDTCDPRLLLVKPTILVQSSPGRFQAYWVLDHPVAPADAEDVNRRIAYYHREQGADTCHDAGHLMRIPYTPNYKHGEMDTAPIVAVLDANRNRYRVTDFSDYPNIVALRFMDDQDVLPDLPQESGDEVIERYRPTLATAFYPLYEQPPEDEKGSWSERLWRLTSMCIEAGMRREETFLVARDAQCNKYARDGRPETELWRDILRVYAKQVEKLQLAPTSTAEIPDFLSMDEIRAVQQRPSFVERYMEWAGKKTDAPRQYHQAGAFIILSALLAGNIYLPTSHSRIHPNLWFMILAGTTLTRKSTAMRIAMEMLRTINSEAEMATDGSVEGLLMGLRDRPGQPSIFLRDEFTGLLDSIAHKEYMAGFAEQLTKLYDGDDIKRLLRKETIHVKDPRFIIFAGGIKDKTQMLLTEEHVMSGFIPRFVFISAEGDPANVRPTGPPQPAQDLDERELLRNELTDIYNHYAVPRPVIKGDKVIGSIPAEFAATLTQEAWARFNVFEDQMRSAAFSTGLGYLVPVHERLTTSTLKAAVLLAAARKRNEGLVVEEIDILHAIYFARRWREYASEIVNGIGKTYDERLIDRIMDFVRINDTGATRAELMTVFRLDMKRADMIFGTMLQRNLVFCIDASGQKRYRAVAVN